MKTGKISEGDKVRFLYPNHGKGNILRKVEGVIAEKKKSQNGPYIVVDETNGNQKSFSYSKIVSITKISKK